MPHWTVLYKLVFTFDFGLVIFDLNSKDTLRKTIKDLRGQKVKRMIMLICAFAFLPFQGFANDSDRLKRERISFLTDCMDELGFRRDVATKNVRKPESHILIPQPLGNPSHMILFANGRARRFKLITRTVTNDLAPLALGA